MKTIPKRFHSAKALVFAPQGRDAAVASILLAESGLASSICSDFVGLTSMLNEQVSFVVVAEEATRAFDFHDIHAWVESQPSWSDLAFIVLTQRGGGPESNPSALRLADTLGNVTFLERPFHPTTFASVVKTAWRGRQRQYEAKIRIEDLHESEERLRIALVAGNLGAWELDIPTRQLTTSPICKSVLGRAPEEEVTYEDLIAAVHPSDASRMKAVVKKSIDNQKDYSAEYRVIWRDGSVHWLDVSARWVPSKDGIGARLVGVSADITQRKTAEENLQRMNETLELRVDQRTAELERTHETILAQIAQRERIEEELRQVQKTEMIGQLTGGVAHDFNNLLMAVLGNLDLLQKHLADDPRGQRLIDGALQGAKRGAALTQRLLAFARKQTLQIEPTEVESLLHDMSDLIQRSVGPTVEIRLKMRDNLPAALIDANQIELALLNLAVNARDAMPDGGLLTIELDSVKIDDADDLERGEYLRLCVSDTGAGMDEATLRRAIEPFFSTKELGKGTGLGLSMIHGVAVQLKGALRLSSKPGIGTRAELFMPATIESASPARADFDTPPLAAPSARATILLVDDDPLIAMSTVDMLEDLGHEVIEAHSGASALQALQKLGSVDLLITDFAMPGMTGAQLAEAVRVKFPDLPVLLATGFAELPSGAGIDLPRLGKPYSQAQLAKEISKLLPVHA